MPLPKSTKTLNPVSGINLRVGEKAESKLPLAQLDIEEEGYQPDIIIVLTDGANGNGSLPLDAAQQAAGRRVRVYTVGFGTQDPGRMNCTRAQLGSDVFGGGGNFGGGMGNFRRYLLLDEPTLRGVADLTGDEYFLAENAEQLLEVFLNLPNRLVLQTQTQEISVIFTAFGALLITVAVGLSLMWNRFP